MSMLVESVLAVLKEVALMLDNRLYFAEMMAQLKMLRLQSFISLRVLKELKLRQQSLAI